MNIRYNNIHKWKIEENIFESGFLGKCEAIMSLGNGYLGIRSATEERYLEEKRGYFVAGTFNKFDKNEVTELPNIADILAIELYLNGQYFTLDKGVIKEYSRTLDLRTGELARHIDWISPRGDEFKLSFYRVVSLKDVHLIAQKVEITPVNHTSSIKVIAGIDGRITNSGSQHLSDHDKRLYDKRYMQMIQTTTESNISFVHNTTCSFTMNKRPQDIDSRIVIERRRIHTEYTGKINMGNTLVIEKISNVYTSRDKENEGLDLSAIQDKSLNAIKLRSDDGYDAILSESSKEWNTKVWNVNPITIESEDPLDQLAIRFAQYHLRIMTPSHDNRMSIAAKGLSGEGYKGHTFWDTDIFILPYFTFTNPEVARRLEEYRYLSLEGARRKARSNGYEGAQYPWESAWIDDGEVTPMWGAADIITGLPMKIWSGLIEQHITADVAYGLWQYYVVTDDEEFMDRYGYEILLDTAKFWASRLEYSEEDNLYHINNVVGPDEYKEHADDNAYTNYMAHWNIRKAMEYYQLLKQNKPSIFEQLDGKLELEKAYKVWNDRVDRIYLPIPRESDLVIPQDKHYLSYKEIDLTKYKNQEQVGSLFFDYNLDQVNKLQVSKQADIMVLFFLMEDIFSSDVKKSNWNYYEPRTLHDSSLSLSTHCIMANDMGDYELAYELYRRASNIDLGHNMKSSDEGIHAASIGGIWQTVVYGFGGVRMLNGKLRIEPNLPKAWSKLQFNIIWKGQILHITIVKDRFTIDNKTREKDITIIHKGKVYTIMNELEIIYQ